MSSLLLALLGCDDPVDGPIGGLVFVIRTDAASCAPPRR